MATRQCFAINPQAPAVRGTPGCRRRCHRRCAPAPIRRRGMSLLELVIATAMMAMLATAVSLLLRSSHQAWDAHEADYTRIEAAHATLRHLVREVRQADSVTEISAAADDSGRLGLSMQNGDTYVWDHDAATDAVNYTTPAGNGLLANQISGLRLTGYLADGITPTTVPSEVHFLEIDVTVQLPRETAGTRVVSSYAWVRSW